MRASRWVGPISASCIITCFSAAGLAQDKAEALFNSGLKQMAAGEYEQGCPAIAESYRLDPRPGVLFTLAECEAKRGRTATAFLRYGEYLTLFATLPPEGQARQHARDKIAREQRAALGPQVPEIALALPPGSSPGTALKCDGVIVAAAARGQGFPVDPGEHVITIEVPGKPRRELRLRIAAGEKKQILLEEGLAAAPPSSPSSPSSPTTGARPLGPSPAPAGRATPGADWRLPAGITAIGLGAASLIVGIVGSVETKSAQDALLPARLGVPTFVNVCASGFQPRASSGLTQADVTRVCNKGQAFEIVQVVAYPLSAVSVVVGAVFLATRPRASPKVTVVPALGPSHASVSVGARF